MATTTSSHRAPADGRSCMLALDAIHVPEAVLSLAKLPPALGAT
jgi:hypothetical protein